MKSILANSALMYALSCCWVLFSFFWAICAKNIEIFTASGSVMIITGAILAAPKYFRVGHKQYFESQKTLDGGTYGDVSPEEQLRTDQEAAGDAQDQHSYRVSFAIMIVGTLIWAYGGFFMRAANLGTP